MLLCLSIDFKGIVNLGPKALIMFLTATLGVVLGGPIALLVVEYIAPGIIPVTADELWRGLATVAGSWIGGGANQTAMKEIFEVDNNLFATMIIVDVTVCKISGWHSYCTVPTSALKLDAKLKADNSAITDLTSWPNFRAKVPENPNYNRRFYTYCSSFWCRCPGTLGSRHHGSFYGKI
ncbi:MAG: DUF819 family protein [Saprospiraceae bacterium]